MSVNVAKITLCKHLTAAAFISVLILAGTGIAGLDPVLYLTANWKLRTQADVASDGATISAVGFNATSWITATVPGTVFTSYVAQGLSPDPIYQNNQTQTDDASQNRQFWYRTEFKVPAAYSGRRIILNFDGINWKADIWVNGHFKGNLAYAFMRGKYDITGDVAADSTACVAVLIYPCAHPGPVRAQTLHWGTINGGVLGADCPTFTASQHWNWIPTVRGRDIGIWDNVYISSVNPVMIQNPIVRSFIPVPDTTKATLWIKATLNNYSSAQNTGTLQASIGGITVSQPCTVGANAAREFVFDTTKFTELRMTNPNLWWPNGYGGQYLYNCTLKYSSAGATSDSQTVKIGIRQITYMIATNKFLLYCNGERILLFGGNWGMPELMLRATPAKYDQWVRMHKEMNYNMIRNWVGQTGHDAFYDACDKYGILIFDDFWLANPGDGPNPDSVAAFIRCAHDKVYRQRNHASVAIWCGRNEGNPSAAASGSPGIAGLDDSLRAATVDHDGTRTYVPSSANDPMAGFGPYELKDPKWYFVNKGSGTLHSELGVVAPMVYESMVLALGSANLWPINTMWGVHDWTQDRDDTFELQLQTRFGAATGITDFCKKAQCVNYQAIQAIYETYQDNRGSGLLLWMSHPAWPSLKCQTYDYFGDYTGGFFAARKACENTHILWNCQNNDVVVANDTRTALTNVQAKAWVYNMDGSQQYYNSVTLSVPRDSSLTVFNLAFPATGLSSVHFVRLRLFKSDGTTLISENFYWRGTTWLNYSSINTLAPAALTVTNNTTSNVTIANTGSTVAFFIRLKVVDNSGNRILPVYYSDNYFTLLPGESKTIALEYAGNGTLVAEPYNGAVTVFVADKRHAQPAVQPALRTTREKFVLSGLPDANNYTVRLMSVRGELVVNTEGAAGPAVHEITIGTKNLARGMYVIHLDSGGKRILTRKVLVP
jgi:hypothetical protein